VGYRYFNTFNVKPAYEFGYGLSYTNFSYENVSIENNIANDEIKVHLTVRNTGKAIGKDVVELYVAAPAKSTDKPKSELRAFAKTRALGPQEKQELTLTLHAADLASFIPEIRSWIVDEGKYQVLLGNSSLNILQTLEFELTDKITQKKGYANFPNDIQMTEFKK
jgi:beta-glucosidase